MWKLSKFFMYQLEQTMNFSFNVSSVKLKVKLSLFLIEKFVNNT